MSTHEAYIKVCTILGIPVDRSTRIKGYPIISFGLVPKHMCVPHGKEEIVGDKDIAGESDLRYCVNCATTHSADAFGKDSYSRDGVASSCKVSVNKRKRERAMIRKVAAPTEGRKTIYIDFCINNLEDLYDYVVAEAKAELRTPEAQILYMLKSHVHSQDAP